MKNILLLVHDDAGQEARFQAALDVTRAVSGHLTCLDVVANPVVVGGDMWGTSANAMILEDERITETANKARLQKRLAVEDVAWSWIDATGDFERCLEQAAILNELIVVNRRIDGSWFPDMRALASDLIIRSGKPILAVPEKAKGFDLSGHALVAWDGSAEADAALQAAVPLLRLAREVTLIEIDDGSIGVAAEEAASFLSRHGAHARIARPAVLGRTTADVLLRDITDRRVDYLVMGGFGHSPVREALVGGVTRSLLTKSPVPLFLAH